MSLAKNILENYLSSSQNEWDEYLELLEYCSENVYEEDVNEILKQFLDKHPRVRRATKTLAIGGAMAMSAIPGKVRADEAPGSGDINGMPQSHYTRLLKSDNGAPLVGSYQYADGKLHNHPGSINIKQGGEADSLISFNKSGTRKAFVKHQRQDAVNHAHSNESMSMNELRAQTVMNAQDKLKDRTAALAQKVDPGAYVSQLKHSGEVVTLGDVRGDRAVRGAKEVINNKYPNITRTKFKNGPMNAKGYRPTVAYREPQKSYCEYLMEEHFGMDEGALAYLHPRNLTKKGREQTHRDNDAEKWHEIRKTLRGWGPDTQKDKEAREVSPNVMGEKAKKDKVAPRYVTDDEHNKRWSEPGIEITASPTLNNKEAQKTPKRSKIKSIQQNFNYPKKVKKVLDAAKYRYGTEKGAYIGSLGHGHTDAWGKERAFKVDMAGVNQNDGDKLGYVLAKNLGQDATVVRPKAPSRLVGPNPYGG